MKPTVTIDLTPTWEETARICIVLLTDGDFEGRQTARAELQRMGRLLDDCVKIQREGKGL